VQIAMLKGLVAGVANFTLALWQGAMLPSTDIVAAAAVIAFLGYGVSLALFVLGLRYLGAARTGAYFSLAPFAGAVLAVVLLREPLTIQLLISGGLMGFGLWLHLAEQHEHEHLHKPIEHEHRHRHDEHHQHDHRPNDPPGEPHSHWHRHARLVHGHPHYPHLHHRHRHPMLERVVTNEPIAAGVRCDRDGPAGRSERRDDRADKIPTALLETTNQALAGCGGIRYLHNGDPEADA
jgi:hypothetical protein